MTVQNEIFKTKRNERENEKYSPNKTKQNEKTHILSINCCGNSNKHKNKPTSIRYKFPNNHNNNNKIREKIHA